MSDSNKVVYKIGTRGSLLALTQCTQVKDQLEKLTGDKFVLEVIKTQGDLITDKPLWQLEGKDFFTKELDHALLTGAVDLVVHSYKDLGSERPEGIELAAITKRQYSEDILLIRKDVQKKLHELDSLVVGTSSPRRIVNIEKTLASLLPAKEGLSVKTKMLRGNVNTRIGKLNNGDYDAIVLAFAGIERLALSPESKKELEVLIKDLDFMVLPQSILPSAASQGALAIECFKDRDDNGALLEKLSLMKDKKTISEVGRERQAFASYGGGCHLAVGIHVKKVGDYYVHTHRGTVDDRVIDVVQTEGAFPTCHDKSSAFVGLSDQKLIGTNYLSDKIIEKRPLEFKETFTTDDLYFTSSHCYSVMEKTSYKALFAAGAKTHQFLAKKGHWVHASSDGLSEEYLQELRSSKLLGMFLGEERKLLALSNDDGTINEGEVLQVYERFIESPSEEYLEKLKNTKVFYWMSAHQYKTYTSFCPEIKEAFHCCGLGKTQLKLKEMGVQVRAFSGLDEFNSWMTQKN